MIALPKLEPSPRPVDLRHQLLLESKTAWLDVGCGGNFEDGFDYIDLFPPEQVAPRYRPRYRQLDILYSPRELIAQMPRYDLVRMQHTLEHFSYEEGQVVLVHSHMLLKSGGILLIT